MAPLNSLELALGYIIGSVSGYNLWFCYNSWCFNICPLEIYSYIALIFYTLIGCTMMGF